MEAKIMGGGRVAMDIEGFCEWVGFQVDGCKDDIALYRDDPAFKAGRDGAMVAIAAKIAAYQAVLGEIKQAGVIDLAAVRRRVDLQKTISKNSLETMFCFAPKRTRRQEWNREILACWLRSFDATLDLVSSKIQREIQRRDTAVARQVMAPGAP